MYCPKRRYWTPQGYARGIGEEYNNGTYLVVNERVFQRRDAGGPDAVMTSSDS